MIKLEKVLYTAKAHTTGAREGGHSISADGRLDVQLSSPGGPGSGTNPEELFAAGWSACYLSAVKILAHKMKLAFPQDSSIDAEVELGPSGEGYALAARLNVRLPGVDREMAGQLLQAAHGICPYSRATQGNIAVVTTLL